jgi:hypothetical protein
MSWNVLLEPTMPPRSITGSQAAKPNRCLRCPPVAKIMPKMLSVAAASQVTPAPIPCIWLAAIQKTRAPLTHADAISLKST